MTSDWEAVKARLEQAYTLSSMQHVQVRKADIRAALERISDLENACMDRDEWRDTARAEMAGRAAAEAEVARLKDRADKAWDAGHIAGREKSPTMQENRELRDRAEAAEAERDEARAELVRTEKLRQQNAEYLERAEAEVARLEGLILDWDDGWRRDPSQDPGAVGRGDEALIAEARRIRAAKGE